MNIRHADPEDAACFRQGSHEGDLQVIWSDLASKRCGASLPLGKSGDTNPNSKIENLGTSLKARAVSRLRASIHPRNNLIVILPSTPICGKHPFAVSAT